MRILVCISNVPDTTTKVKFSNDHTSFDDSGVQWIINPWDELALTRAMELKEDASNPVSNVTVVTVGSASVEPTLRKALAIGADGGTVRAAPGLGHDLLTSIGPDAGQGSALDLHHEHAAIGTRDGSFGKLEAGRDDLEIDRSATHGASVPPTAVP